MSNRILLEGYKEIPVTSLYVPNDYQREFKQKWVDDRVDKFDVDKLGTLVVSSTGNGKYAVIDGQHRLALTRAAQEAAKPDVPTALWCEVRIGHSRESEAALFLGRNDAQPMQPIDKFRARVVAGEPTANAIKDIMAVFGVQIGYPTVSKDSHNYGCVTAIEKVHASGQLAAVIRIIEESWGENFGKAARIQLTIDGVSLFHNTYRTQSRYSVENAISGFSKIEKFSSIKAQAKNNATANSTQVSYQFALLLIPRYNYGKQGQNRLVVNSLIEAYS